MNSKNYVFSTRPIHDFGDKITYAGKNEENRRKLDTALPHFNIGHYSITFPPGADSRENIIAPSPEFHTNNNYPEMDDFANYNSGNYKPGTETKKVFDEVFTKLKTTNKILYIYLHGFGNDTEKEKNKQVIPMWHSYYTHPKNENSPVGEIIFLTWPSQGFIQYKHGEKEDVSKMAGSVTVFFLKLFNYVNDRTNALFNDGWKPRIVFHSQSMGCKILQTAVARLNFIQEANLVKKNILDKFFYRIIMTGADLDLDALNDCEDEEGEEIHQLAERILLFYNKKDRALWISRFIFSSGKRLGRHLDQDTMNLLPKNIDLIELHGNGRDIIGHNYFTENEKVVTQLQQALHDHHFDGIALEPRGRKIEFNLHDGSCQCEWLHES
jgi:esterase/lipase superfamily enzyme